MGRATERDYQQAARGSDFNPRPPWGGRRFQRQNPAQAFYFNPRPPWGGRHFCRVRQKQLTAFQSTPSVGRATLQSANITKSPKFQSTPSVGRATKIRIYFHSHVAISIHALRGEGDPRGGLYGHVNCDFNPRPPWGGRRHVVNHTVAFFHFNPRPPWGGRRSVVTIRKGAVYDFNPRPPWGGRLDSWERPDLEDYISIHALRGEGDAIPIRKSGVESIYFNPRPPWGGRLILGNALTLKIIFQSTPSVGRATADKATTGTRTENFNPRPPWGGRRWRSGRARAPWFISIHALRGEGDY